MIKKFSDSKLKKLVNDICNEHFGIAKSNDYNITFLWRLYSQKTSLNGAFRPFIFITELNLLFKTGYITEIERDNMLQMLNSPDEDNINILAYSILTLRKNRIKDLGLWLLDNDKYSELDYIKDVINHTMFQSKNIKL